MSITQYSIEHRHLAQKITSVMNPHSSLILPHTLQTYGFRVNLMQMTQNSYLCL